MRKSKLIRNQLSRKIVYYLRKQAIEVYYVDQRIIYC